MHNDRICSNVREGHTGNRVAIIRRAGNRDAVELPLIRERGVRLWWSMLRNHCERYRLSYPRNLILRLNNYGWRTQRGE
jgi:hypothetical protein